MSKIKNTLTAETKSTTLATSDDATKNIMAAAEAEASSDRTLKFKKGTYSNNEKDVPLGAEFLAHASQWIKIWIKFVEGEKPRKQVYSVAKGEIPPEREELDDYDSLGWPIKDGKPKDPWVFQYLLPLENMTTREVLIFTTQSIGGRIAVADLCLAFARRKKSGRDGQPIIKLASVMMPTKQHGPVPKPSFPVIGWDDADADTDELMTTITGGAGNIPPAHDDMEDEIPDFK